MPAAKFDIENLLDAVKTFLAANLNTQIAALNTEKNDGISLKTVDSTAYHLQYPEDRTELSDPFIIYEEADEPRIQPNSGALIATTHHVGVTVVLADNKMDLDIVKRLFRYRRALADLFQARWASVVGSHEFVLQAWSPTPPFKNLDSGFSGRAVGVVLSVTLTD
jgi:hypothetical protein